MKIFKIAFAFLLCSQMAYSQSVINRLWQAKKYQEIISYSPKGNARSGVDNTFIGRAFMQLDQPEKALEHFDIAIAKRWQSEDLYFFRSMALVELERFDEALSDLEVCLTMRPNYQKYLLAKASVAYNSGDLALALATNKTLMELYEKQMPFYMTAQILIEMERYKEARDRVNQNLKQFANNQEFWMLTAEQSLGLEWYTFKNYGKALSLQQEMLKRGGDQPQFWVNEIILLRLLGNEKEAQAKENAMVHRYNTNKLPSSFYKSGSLMVAQFDRPNGLVQDFRYFRPGLKGGNKYARFYLSNNNRVLGSVKGQLIPSTSAPDQFKWAINGAYSVDALDTNYVGFLHVVELDSDSLEATGALGFELLELRDTVGTKDTVR